MSIYLTKSSKSNSLIKKWKIIPIRFHKNTNFECYSEDIYSPGENNIDSEKYKILDSNVMSPEIFNKIYAYTDGNYQPIRIFSKEIVIDEFFNVICGVLNTENPKERAEKLLALYNSEKNLFQETHKLRKIPTEKIFFKTRTGNVFEKNKCFVCGDLSSQNCLDSIVVDKEYVEFAKFIGTPSIETISSYEQIPFEIGRRELAEIHNNKNLPKKSEIFASLYLFDKRAQALLNGLGFFELYSLTPLKLRMNRNQPPLNIAITEEVLKLYSDEINEISIAGIPIQFTVEFLISVFEKDNILSEIENELQLRKENEKIITIKGLLSNCFYAPVLTREPCCVKTQNKNLFLIDSKITADYDIIEVLKSYFLKYFNTELYINRNIRLYNRRGFENISTIYSTEDDVAAALPMISSVNLNNVEEVKDFICRPLMLNGITYGGYAKTCPLCGAVVNTELTGMRIYKTKSDGIIIPLISCTNCHENLKYSSYVNINTEKLKAGLLDMECQINGFEWHISDKVIRLGHRVLIEKLNQK